MLNIPTIKEKISPICKQYGVKEAYLFGSYARGDATEESDIDLRIEKGAITNLFELSGFRLDLMDALGVKVDLLSVMPESPSFLKNLRRDEVLIYELQ